MTAVEFRVLIDENERHDALAHDVRTFLTATPKSLPPTWFYDDRGSELFEQITGLFEYYPTRTERSILERHVQSIVEIMDGDTLVELGSGSTEKTRILLDAMAKNGTLSRFVPFDVSEETLRESAADIAATYEIGVIGVIGDFNRHLGAIPTEGTRSIALLGGTIGNLDHFQRHRFLTALRATMGPRDSLLLGIDLEKDIGRLVAAYDDPHGVTAAFNRNVLYVVNRELGANFEPESFQHIALWNEEQRRIEMRLRSQSDQDIDIKELDIALNFERGEEILTEISCKFTRERITDELVRAGFVVAGCFADDANDFLLTVARPED